MAFDIPELHETVRAKKRPIVIITSNAEKELPDAFYDAVYSTIFPSRPQNVCVKL